MGVNAQVMSLRQQVQRAQAEAAQARRDREIAEEFLAHAQERIDQLEAEAAQAEQIGELLISVMTAAQELTGMVPGEMRLDVDTVPADDQRVVSLTRMLTLEEALYRIQCYAEGKQPVGVGA